MLGGCADCEALMEARHERRLNQAAFKQSTFINLVTSGNRGEFITAMKDFGWIQTMEVPPEPHLWPPWKMLNWWGKPIKPNWRPLYGWSRYSLPLCTPQRCGEPDKNEPMNADKGIRIDLREANLSLTDLRGIVLSKADLRKANLNGADLREAMLNEANLVGTDLRGAKLLGAMLNGADLSKANLVGTNLRGADLRKANLNRADLSKANLVGTDLHGAKLLGADLRETILREVKLQNDLGFLVANLSEADLTLTNLSGADLREATRIYFIKWDDRTRWPEGFTPPLSR